MRKKILIFGHNYGPQFVDIYNQYTKVFDPSQYEVSVAFLTGPDNEEVRKKILAEKIVFLDFSKKHIRNLKIRPFIKLFNLYKQNRYQMVICHRYKPSYLFLCLAQVFKIPAIFFVMHELGTMSSLARRMLVSCLQKKNMLFAGVSNAVRDDIRSDLKSISKERIITLYNMLDVELMRPKLLSKKEARAALSLSDDVIVFGNLARLVKNKDHTTLLQAFSNILPNCPNARLIIMGDGELEKPLKELTQELGLEKHVTFTGFLTNAFTYMQAFDCFVLSSIQEAFGRVLLEAMLANLPIIATKVHGIPEVMGESGVLIEPKNALSLANAMQTFYSLADYDKEKLAQQSLQQLQKHYTVNTFIDIFWEIPLIKSAVLFN